MTYVLNSAAALPAEKPSDLKGPGFWQRFYAALVDSRHRAAQRELRAYSYLVNQAEQVLGDLPHTTHGKDASLPFNR